MADETNTNTEPKYTPKEFFTKFNSGEIDVREYVPELKEDKGYEKFVKNPLTGPYKSFRELEKSRIPKQPENATPEQLKQWRVANGFQPDSPDKYQFDNNIEGADEDYKNRFMGEPSVKAMQQYADEMGLSVDQAKQLWTKSHQVQLANLRARTEAEKKMHEQELAEMDTTWGDSKEEKLQFVDKALTEMAKGDESILNDLKKSLTKFKVLNGLATLGEQLSGKRKIEDISNAPQSKTLSQIETEIEIFRKENDHIFADRTDTRRASKVEEMNRLLEQRAKVMGK